MAIKFDFHIENDNRKDRKIQAVMQADFPLPEQAEKAKNEAFAKIRKMADSGTATEKEHRRKTGKLKTVFKTALGMTAAAGIFSAVCITNPTFAENIPLVGNVFERIGDSLGFSGDFSEYAEPVDKEATDTEEKNGEKKDTEDTRWSQTYNGTTVTVSEVYCNDAALYLSLVISMEDKIPDTMTTQDGTPYIRLDHGLVRINSSFNEGELMAEGQLDGKLLDEHTFAGVIRISKDVLTVDQVGIEKFDKAWEDFWKEKGIDAWNCSSEEMAFAIGLDTEDLTDQQTQDAVIAAGGPDEKDYVKEIKIPDQFTLDISISQIVGELPEEEISTPEMPQELKDEYTQAMAEQGLDESNYENFTEEQKETEHRLYTEMWNKYQELYPETSEYPNKYENWWVDGDWKFTIPVDKNDAHTETKEIQVADEEGNGIVSVTKTPFEITLNESGDTQNCVPVVLDAEGNLLEGGKFGNPMTTVAISGKDVSTVYIYLCDYDEYMDELKGYYWSEDYKEKAKTKTFKQLLDERAIASAQVQFNS